MKKPALGRGLDALFPGDSHEGEVIRVPISLLDPNPDQPRKAFAEDSLQELTDSIRQIGLLQPILVYPEGERYRVIAGERRFRASMKAGLSSVPVLVRSLPEHERRLAALTENLQREDLNAMEAAQAVQLLMEEGGLTQEQAAEKLGKSRPAVTNLLRLLKLEDEVQGLVRSGRLSEGHARTLAGIHDGTRQVALARKAVKEGLSVRALEALVNQPVPKGKPAVKSLLPEMAEFQDRLQEALGVRAQVSGSLTKGRILLRYNSSEELEGIYEAVLRMLG
jgi:ParB family chromosome partitioning protein